MACRLAESAPGRRYDIGKGQSGEHDEREMRRWVNTDLLTPVHAVLRGRIYASLH